MSTNLNKKIAELEARVTKYEIELDSSSSTEEKTEIRQLIHTRSETLNKLLEEKKRKYITQDSYRYSGISWEGGEKFDFLGHGIELAQFAVGVLGLGSLVVGGGFYVAKQNQRATVKFFDSLLAVSDSKLSKINCRVLPRGDLVIAGTERIKKLNLGSSFRSVALVGDNQSGKTIFLYDTVLNSMFPWWYRFFLAPRGLFLTGAQKHPTIDAWLKNQIATNERNDPWSALADLLLQRRREQRIRHFLHKLFKDRVPDLLKPQPAIIVIDQAEELLRAYRATFLVGFYNLVKEARDDDLFRLVFVINTDHAVRALELMNGGNMFDVIAAPKVSREAVVATYGDDFAKVFDDCDSCIGVAIDYISDKKRPEKMTAKEYAANKKQSYLNNNCLTQEISREEYADAGMHVKM